MYIVIKKLKSWLKSLASLHQQKFYNASTTLESMDD